MDWTSIYLKTSGLNVFILGTGEVAIRRANKFLENGASVKLAGSHIDDVMVEKGASFHTTDEINELIEWSDLVVIANDDVELADYVASLAQDKLINRADIPEDCDFIVPTSFNIGDVGISIFTNGKSPLMARKLRERIQDIITEEDILEIELQDYARTLLKKAILNQKRRRQYLYEIFEDETIDEFIKSRDISEAKSYIDNLIKGFDDT